MIKQSLVATLLSLLVALPVGAQVTSSATGTMRGRLEAQRMEFRDRLQNVRDTRMREIGERVNDRLLSLNENRKDHFTAVLEKLVKVLDRIKARVEKAAARGLDVSAVRTAITDAEKAIADARAAIAAQAAKTYSITITGDAGLRGAVKQVRDALHTDLVSVRDAIKKAHEAVRKAAVALAQIPRGDDNLRPTSTNP